jgi:muramidase (phage lysozyme)
MGVALTYLDLQEALDKPNVNAFLKMIRAGEGTSDEDGYRRHFGGELFTSFTDHPRKVIAKKSRGKMLFSSAAGAYQFLARTWDEMSALYGLKDFSPINQDIAAVGLIHRRRALADVIEGRFHEAVRKCAAEWASLPESPHDQPTRTYWEAFAVYEAAGGRVEGADVA